MEFPKTRGLAAGFEHLGETGSTNRDLLEMAKNRQLPEFYVLSTDFQSSGRGRMDRIWEAAPGTSVMASVLLRPAFDKAVGIGWIPLLTALSITKAFQELGISSLVKWPNDVLIGQKKVSGILAEASIDLSTVVVGFGINLSQQKNELPVETATSLLLATGRQFDRDQLLSLVLANLMDSYRELTNFQGDAERSGLRNALLEHSATVGKEVSVEFPDGTKAIGRAIDIDDSGRLVVESGGLTLNVSAGDVLHLRTT